jgi:hypothetical protein
LPCYNPAVFKIVLSLKLLSNTSLKPYLACSSCRVTFNYKATG